MKKFIYLICFLFFVNSLTAQNITGFTETTPIFCSGGSAEWLVETNATTDFSYQIQFESPAGSGIWFGLGLVSVISPQVNFNVDLLSGYKRVVTYDIGGAIVSTSAIEYIEPKEPIQVFTLSDDVSCFGFNDGSINLSVFGGTLPYVFIWSNGAPTSSDSSINLVAGTYTVFVEDSLGCTYVSNPISVTIDEPLVLVASNTPSNFNGFGVRCNGGNDGVITVSETGGVSPYTYSIDGITFQTSNIFSGLSEDTYNIIVKDANGCTETTQAILTQPPVLVASNTPSNFNGFGVRCNGGNDGVITVSQSGGVSPYAYSIDGITFQTSNIFSGLSEDTYNIIVKDANGCEETTQATLTEPIDLIASAIVTSDFTGFGVSCNGGDDGEITVSESGGVSPYTYSIDGITFQTSNIFSGLSAVTYTLTVKDDNGCNETDVEFLSEPLNPLLVQSTHLFFNGFGVECNGDSNGVATLSLVTGGTAGYSYSWNTSPVQNTLQATGLIAGNYTCTVIDTNGCIDSTSLTIVEPPILVLSLNITSAFNGYDVSCSGSSDGTATALATGGSGGYDYFWFSNPTQTTSQAIDLSAETYICSVIDTNGCAISDSVTLFEPSPLNHVAFNDFLSCNGDSNGVISVIPSGSVPGYTFSWNTIPVQTTSEAIGLFAGSYICTVIDTNGCTDIISSISVGEPTNPLVVTMLDSTAVSCNGGSDGTATVLANGGLGTYSYLWSNGDISDQATGLPAGLNTCIVTDGNLCVVSQDVFISQPDPLLVSTSLITPVSCNGGDDATANAIATGGTTPYTYVWSNFFTGTIIGTSLSGIISSLSAGVYSVNVTGDPSCISGTATITINQPSPLIVTASIDSVSCYNGFDGQINLSVSGGNPSYSFQWSDGQTTISAIGLVEGAYNVIVSDSTNCIDTSTYFVGDPLEALFAIADPTQTSCFGIADGSIIITTTGGTPAYSYLWSNGSATQEISTLLPGSYNCTITDSRNCTTTATAIVDEPDSIFIITESLVTSCFGYADGTATANAQGGISPYSYSWSNGDTNMTAMNLTAGIYSIFVSDDNGCLANEDVEVTEPELIIANFSTTNILQCYGDTTGQIEVLSPSGGNGSPYTYNWSNGSNNPLIQNLPAGNYYVTITDIIGCSITLDTLLIEPLVLSTTYSSSNVSVNGAGDGNISVTVYGGVPIYTYNWTGPNSYSNNTSSINSLEEGNYQLTVTDGNGCITSPPDYYISAPDCDSIISPTLVNPLCYGQLGEVYWENSNGIAPYYNTLDGPNGNTIIDSLIFNFPSTSLYLSAGDYTLTVHDASGSCADIWNIEIIAPDSIGLDLSNSTDVLCYGDNTGIADLNISGGTAPYIIDWGTTNPNFVSAGSYNVLVTDGNGCQKIKAYIIDEPDEFLIDSVITTLVSCHGSDGSATCYATGGSFPYTYSWLPSSTSGLSNTNPFIALNSGIYSVIVTDNMGCSDTNLNVQITNDLLFSMDIQESLISCSNDSDGVLTAILIDGARPITYTWENSLTGIIISNDSVVSGLSAGPYDLFAIDANNCVYQNFITLSNPVPISFSLLATNLTSNGSNDGSITTIGISGGQAPYTYAWTGIDIVYSAITANINNLEAGTYTLQITDTNGCVSSQSEVINQPECDLMISEVYLAPPCFGDSAALIWTNSGGSGAYTNIITNSTGSQVYNSFNSSSVYLAVGESYSLLVQDQLNPTCQDIYAAVTTSPAPLVAMISTVNVSCFGDTNGSVIVTPEGGTGPYSINYGGINPDSLAAGTYSILLTDANGCSSIPPQTIFSISQPLEMNTEFLSSNVSCFDANDGSATINVVGGTAPYDYFWSPTGDTTQTINNLSEGTYFISIIDNNNCSTIDSLDISQPNLELDATFSVTNVACYGFADGELDLSPSGGTAPYSYLWIHNGITAEDLVGQGAGSYDVVVYDANACVDTFSTVITEPTEITVLVNSINASCFDEEDGSASLDINGGEPFYTYEWYDGSVNSTVQDLGMGAYWVKVTDFTGCHITGDEERTFFNISEPDVLSLSTSVMTSPSCFNLEDASVDVTVSGGTPAYNYTWLDSFNDTVSNSLDSFATNLGSGTYNVLVADVNGCNDTASILISEPGSIIADIITDSTSCYGSSDGSATAIASGGTVPYTYVWSGGLLVSNTDTYTDLNASTNYYVSITDSNGCNINGVPVNVSQPDLMSIDFLLSDYNGYNITCYNGSDAQITASVNGGNSPYELSLDTLFYLSNTVFSNNSSGWLTLYAKDSLGCEVSDSVLITAPDPIDANIFIVNSLTCSGFDDAVLASFPSGGVSPYLYLWSDGGSISYIDSLSAGSYSIEVIDENNCSAFDTVILDPNFIILANSDFTQVSCAGSSDGTAIQHPSGGVLPYTYIWSDSNGNTISTIDSVYDLAPGMYTCLIADNNGCEIIDTINIIESPTNLTISAISDNNVSCNGENTGIASVIASGGTFPYSYLWDDVNTQTTSEATGLFAGTFIVAVTDTAFCTVYDTIIISEPLAPLTTAVEVTDISCFGLVDGDLTVSFMGGIAPYVYNWFGPNAYTSSNDSIINLVKGEYVISVTDSNGCITIDTSYIVEPEIFTAVSYTNNPSCYGDFNGDISLSFNGGVPPYSATYGLETFTFVNDSSSIISSLSAGSDSISIVDYNGCENTYFVTLESPLELIIDSLSITNATCFDSPDGSLNVNIVGGTPDYNFQLIDENNLIIADSNIVSGLSSGEYLFQVFDANSCAKEQIVSISNPEEIEVIQDMSSCYGSILIDVVNAIGNYEIIWQGDIADSSYIDNLFPGEYQVTVFDALGCYKVDSFVVNKIFDYEITDASCSKLEDGIINIINTGSPTYSLYLNDVLLNSDVTNSIEITDLLTGTYILSMNDADGCILSDTILFVDVIGGYNCIDVPIIITPNSDGINDNWHPIYDVDTEIQVTILNRWGAAEYYYEGNSVAFEWDGLNGSGNKLPSTDYYYIIKFQDITYLDRTGVITLMR